MGSMAHFATVPIIVEVNGQTRMDSERGLITIQSFRELPEAMIAKGVLNSAGIECFLVDDNTGRMLGFISDVIGGIRIQVNSIDAEAAKALLHQPLAGAVVEVVEPNEQQQRCPKCYSVDITCHELDKPMTHSGAWLNDPLPVHVRLCTCRSCGYEWDDEDNT